MRRALRSRKALLVALLTVGALALPALAAAKPVLAVGDQKASMFADARFRWLNIRHSRLVVSWRIEQTQWERELVAQWMDGAKRAGVHPLIAFGHVWGGKRRTELPSVKEYTRTVADFRKRYPWVRDYTPWNEANHCSQPTCKHPASAASYYNVLRARCKNCTVVAADVLDQPNMVPWLRSFRRHANGHPRLWGLHNYLDANSLRTSGTQHLLKAVKGTIWMTETGGIVRRTHYRKQIAGFEESPAHAATATAWILRLANRYPRIRRVYLYQWNANSTTQVWDSGLIGVFGERRPGFDVLARAMGRDPNQAPEGPGATPGPPPFNEQPPPTDSSKPPPPSSDQQPPSGGGGSGGGGSPSPTPTPPPAPVPPPPPPCPLPVCTIGVGG